MRLAVLGIGAAVTGIHAIIGADSLLSRSSLYRTPRDVILDSVLGRAEEFEYTGTTTPSVARSTP